MASLARVARRARGDLARCARAALARPRVAARGVGLGVVDDARGTGAGGFAKRALSGDARVFGAPFAARREEDGARDARGDARARASMVFARGVRASARARRWTSGGAVTARRRLASAARER